MAGTVLGLDLGPNSIGWALIEEDPSNPDMGRLIDIGVRVFPEGVDAFETSKEVSRNEDRRVARAMRRQILRRARRRRQLRIGLIDAGLWPSDPAMESELQRLDPYALRAKAVLEPLSLHELGRIFLHLNQRRGFLSNRKNDRGDAEVKGMLAEINENERERETAGFKTVGGWLADKQEKLNHAERQENDHVRKRHLARQQFEEEFEAIWTEQAKHHPEILTDELKGGIQGSQIYPCKPRRRAAGTTPLKAFGIRGLIFFQRPMYWPKSVVGLCELERKQKRCPRSDRRYQRFRLLQEVNNLKYIDSDTHTEQSLNEVQRKLLLDKLTKTKEMTFDQIRKALNFLESVKFNLERGKRSRLQGVPIDTLFANKQVLGPDWYARSEEERTEIVSAILDNERDDDHLIERAVTQWRMTPTQIENALAVDLPAGYGNLSVVALEKLLPYMEQGLLYMAEDETDSAIHAAGYLRPDQLLRRIFDKLPDPKRVQDCPIGDIPNPVVKRTLTEVRRVVNAIIREHGKPNAVHVEMAREVQQGKKSRNEYSKRIREREDERRKAADMLREHGVRVTRENILKYMLWDQQGHECIYSGKIISVQKLFGEGGGVEIDHILPYQRTLDDSQMNKVVCLRDANLGKGDKTPYEWLADVDATRYEAVCQRVGKLMRAGQLPYAKYRRFIQKELDLDKFIARQLTDTSYITRATAEYLRCLFGQDHTVLGLKGQLTSELRWHWGLETVLEEIPNSPGWQDKNAGTLRPGEKNRADHRHHAIDAVVVALTNRSRLQQLSRIVKTGGARAHGEILLDPWPNFRDAVVNAIGGINVSHRAERKVSGRLHEETLYGPTPTPGEWVVRKKVVDLSPNEVERIRDDEIRRIVRARLQEFGIEVGRGKKPDNQKWKQALSGLAMPSGVPIKKVRILKPELTIQSIRSGKPSEAYVKPGSTHHLCIFEWEANGTRRRDAVFVTMLEATNRIKNCEAIIQRTSPDDHPTIPKDARFLMSLSRGEMVWANWRGEKRLLVFRTAASTQGQLYFAEHTDARKSADYRKHVAKANTLEGSKVTVDTLGRIRWAND